MESESTDVKPEALKQLVELVKFLVFKNYLTLSSFINNAYKQADQSLYHCRVLKKMQHVMLYWWITYSFMFCNNNWLILMKVNNDLQKYNNDVNRAADFYFQNFQNINNDDPVNFFY